jgi:hypothetical protein
MRMVRQCDGSKHDVAYNGPIVFGDKGNNGIGFTTKPVDKLGFARRFESGGV